MKVFSILLLACFINGYLAKLCYNDVDSGEPATSITCPKLDGKESTGCFISQESDVVARHCIPPGETKEFSCSNADGLHICYCEADNCNKDWTSAGENGAAALSSFIPALAVVCLAKLFL